MKILFEEVVFRNILEWLLIGTFVLWGANFFMSNKYIKYCAIGTGVCSCFLWGTFLLINGLRMFNWPRIVLKFGRRWSCLPSAFCFKNFFNKFAFLNFFYKPPHLFHIFLFRSIFWLFIGVGVYYLLCLQLKLKKEMRE